MIDLYVYFFPFEIAQLSQDSISQASAEKINVLDMPLPHTWQLALLTLSEDERQKVTRYKQLKMQFQALQVRALLRFLLSKHGDKKPSEWQFEYGDKGKPRLSTVQFNEHRLVFNLSHSGDYLMITIAKDNGVANLQIGCDIERYRKSTNIHSVMKHYFSAKEIQDVHRLDESLQIDRFFDLWALKEAYIKATGKGLSQKLSSFTFSFQANQVLLMVGYTRQGQSNADLFITPYKHDESYVHLQPSVEDNMSWQSIFGRINPQYRFALCVGTTTDARLNIIPEVLSLDEITFI